MSLTDSVKKSNDAANALCVGVFSILRNIEYIEKDFPLLNVEQIKKFSKEYIYYRIFLVDYKTYCILSQFTLAKVMLLDCFYKEVETTFTEINLKALIPLDTTEMKARIDLYTNLYRNAGFDDSKAEGYSCAKILTLAGLETNRDYDANQYFNFRMGYFLKDNIAFYKLIQNVLSFFVTKTNQSAITATSSSGCLLPIITTFAVVLLMSFL